MEQQKETRLKYIGKDYAIHDAEQKVRGGLVYTADRGPERMLSLRLLLSPVAHGLIKKIDTAAAERVEGVIKIYTHENTPATTYNTYRPVPDQAFCVPDQRILTEKVRHYGDRVAAVAALTDEAAIKAAALIRLEIEELPPLIDAAASLEATAPPIHKGGNRIGDYQAEYGQPVTEEAADSALVTTRVHTQRMHHAAIEPHAYLADYDGRLLTIWTPTQGVYGCRTVVADYLGMSYSHVRVIKQPLGGSFGGKQEFILEPLIAYIARDLGRPVMLRYDRRQSIIGTIVRAAHDFRVTSRAAKDGRLLEVSAEDLLDAGAYLGNSVTQANAIATKALRLYRIPYYRHQSTVAYTNSVPAGGMRGWGSPEFYTALEIHLDQLAARLGLDPMDLRLRNLVHPGDVTAAENLSLGNCRVIECLERGAEEFRWKERWHEAPGRGRYRRGVGLACGTHKNNMYGKGFPDLTSLTLKMNSDGSVELIGSFHEMGCGTLRSMQLIVAEVLDLAPGQISVTEGDTAVTPYDAGTYASRVTYIMGRCAELAAEALRDKLFDLASRLFGVPAPELRLTGEGIGRKSPGDARTTAMTYHQLAQAALSKFREDLIVTQTLRAEDNPNASSVQFAEVEVDTLTGLVKVTDFLVAQDVGLALNRSMVEGQIQGGVHLGLGYALCEEVDLLDNGAVRSESFEKYHMINFFDMPRVRVLLIEDGKTSWPFGAKGVGEMATVPTAAAVVNAVNHALGSRLSHLPLTPEKILAEISGRQKQGGNR